MRALIRLIFAKFILNLLTYQTSRTHRNYDQCVAKVRVLPLYRTMRAFSNKKCAILGFGRVHSSFRLLFIFRMRYKLRKIPHNSFDPCLVFPSAPTSFQVAKPSQLVPFFFPHFRFSEDHLNQRETEEPKRSPRFPKSLTRQDGESARNKWSCSPNFSNISLSLDFP